MLRSFPRALYGTRELQRTGTAAFHHLSGHLALGPNTQSGGTSPSSLHLCHYLSASNYNGKCECLSPTYVYSQRKYSVVLYYSHEKHNWLWSIKDGKVIILITVISLFAWMMPNYDWKMVQLNWNVCRGRIKDSDILNGGWIIERRLRLL